MKSYAVVLLVVAVASLVVEASIASSLTVTTKTLSENVKGQGTGFRYNSYTSMGATPIYTRVTPDGATHVAWAGTSGNVFITGFDTSLSQTYQWSVAGVDVRGFYKHETGEAAILTWRMVSGGTCSPCDPTSGCAGGCAEMFLVRFDCAGNVLYDTRIDDRIYDFSLGTGRLEYVNGKYHAYYKVTTITTMCTSLQPGHQGDTYKIFDAVAGPGTFSPSASIPSPGWCWGCSHSMDARLALNLNNSVVMPACITDAYPSPEGVYFNHNSAIFAVKGGANGYTNGELGGLVPYGNDFLVTWTSPRSSSTAFGNGTDVGFARVTSQGHVVGSVVWLTDLTSTSKKYATYSHIAAYGCSGQFIVQWAEGTATNAPSVAKAMIIDASGTVISAAEDLTAMATWSDRDDHATAPDGSMIYATVWSGTNPAFGYSAGSPSPSLRFVKVAATGCTPAPFTATPCGATPTTTTATATGGAIVSGTTAGADSGSGSSALSSGAVAGIVIAVVAVVIIVAIIVGFVIWRRRRAGGGGGGGKKKAAGASNSASGVQSGEDSLESAQEIDDEELGEGDEASAEEEWDPDAEGEAEGDEEVDVTITVNE